MPVEIDIAHVARLARIELSEAELAEYKEQLAIILDHAARVQSLDAEVADEGAHPLGFVNAFREDAVVPSLDHDEVMAQAPEVADGFFVVPPAMDIE